jgi:microcystin degradation protein MlrC
VKSSVHFRAAFAPLAGDILICIAPGSMPVDTSALPWSRLAPDVRLQPRSKLIGGLKKMPEGTTDHGRD